MNVVVCGEKKKNHGTKSRKARAARYPKSVEILLTPKGVKSFPINVANAVLLYLNYRRIDDLPFSSCFAFLCGGGGRRCSFLHKAEWVGSKVG